MQQQPLYNRITKALTRLSDFNKKKGNITKQLHTIRSKAHTQKDATEISTLREHIDTLE